MKTNLLVTFIVLLCGLSATAISPVRGPYIDPATVPTLAASNTYTGTKQAMPHIAGTGSTPGIAAGAGAGTSPTVSISGTDMKGKITVTTGTTPTNSATIVTVTFATAYGAVPTVNISPHNGVTATLPGVANKNPFVSGESTTVFLLTSGATGLTASTAYEWTYQVME